MVTKQNLTKVPTNLPPEREYFLTVWVWKMLLERERFPRDISILLFFFIMFASSTSMSKTTMAGFFFLVTDRLISYLRTHTRKEFFSTRTHPWSVDRKRKCKVNLQQNHTCSALPIRPATDHQAAHGQPTWLQSTYWHASPTHVSPAAQHWQHAMQVGNRCTKQHTCSVRSNDTPMFHFYAMVHLDALAFNKLQIQT